MNRYEKRAREITEITNQQIRNGQLLAGSMAYQDREWLIETLFRVGKTYKSK